MRSMTGFGKADAVIGNSHFSFEVKSVNHRFLDARFRLPFGLNSLELQLTEVLREHFERGSFEVNLKQKLHVTDGHSAVGTRFVVDEVAAKSLVEGCHFLHQNYQTERIPSLEVFAMTNRVFLPVDEGQDVAVLWAPLKALFEKTLTDLKQMRTIEGKRIHTVLESAIEQIRMHTASIRKLAPEQGNQIKQKLEARLANWKLTAPVDSTRLEWEVAMLAEKADIVEEMDRLEMHCKEYLAFLKQDKPMGRKLDFLTQELHREVNTIASKASMIDITRISVELKTVIERLREQVQNVE